MSVNFDKLPDKNPTNVPAAGFYKFTVIKAEMKKGKDLTKPEYLNTTLSLTDITGKKHGNIFDGQYESEAQAMQFKLKRFVRACGVELHGDIELRDIAKVVANRSGVLELENVPDNRDPSKTRAQVRVFGSDCYWLLSEFASLVAGAAPDTSTPDADEAFVFSDDDAPVPAAADSQNTGVSEY